MTTRTPTEVAAALRASPFRLSADAREAADTLDHLTAELAGARTDIERCQEVLATAAKEVVDWKARADLLAEEIKALRDETVAVSWPNMPHRAGKMYDLTDIGPLLDRAEKAESELFLARDSVMCEKQRAENRCDPMTGPVLKLPNARAESAERERDEARAQVANLERKAADFAQYIHHYEEVPAGDREQHMSLWPVTHREMEAREQVRVLREALSKVYIATEVMPHRSADPQHDNATPPPSPSSGAGAVSPEEEALKKCRALGLFPFLEPLGDEHHTDIPLTKKDREIGDAVAYFLGGIFCDVEGENSRYWYYEMTSVDVWSRIARALRIHGLQIGQASGTGADRDEKREAVIRAALKFAKFCRAKSWRQVKEIVPEFIEAVEGVCVACAALPEEETP